MQRKRQTGVRGIRLGLAAALLLAAGCSTEPLREGERDDGAEVRELEAAYTSAWRRNDRAAVMATLAEGAVLLPGGLAPVAGHEAIEAFWWPAEGPTTTVSDYRTTIDEVVVSGGLAYVRGTGQLSFTWTAADGTGGARQSHSVFLSLASRGSDGSWRIARRMWHETPEPGAAQQPSP